MMNLSKVVSDNNESNDFKENEYCSVFLRNSKYHQKHLKKNKEGLATFNFLGFLLGGSYFLINGVLSWGIGYILILVFAGFLFIPYNEHLFITLNVFLNMMVGIKFNSVFYDTIEKEIKLAKERTHDHEMRIDKLRKTRGSNIILGSILALIMMLVTGLVGAYDFQAHAVNDFVHQMKELDIYDNEIKVNDMFVEMSNDDSLMFQKRGKLTNFIIPAQSNVVNSLEEITVKDHELIIYLDMNIKAHKKKLKAFETIELAYYRNDGDMLNRGYRIWNLANNRIKDANQYFDENLRVE